jgi:hypothetical protein
VHSQTNPGLTAVCAIITYRGCAEKAYIRIVEYSSRLRSQIRQTALGHCVITFSEHIKMSLKGVDTEHASQPDRAPFNPDQECRVRRKIDCVVLPLVSTTSSSSGVLLALKTNISQRRCALFSLPSVGSPAFMLSHSCGIVSTDRPFRPR